MEKIAIVTDSTADLPLSYYEANNVQMVPLTVRFGEKSFKDWIDINPKEFYQRMRDSDILPKTSQPSVAQFAQVYQKLAGEAEQIVSIHLSSELSGTVQAAEMARDMANVPVTVIDTKSGSLGTGLIVDAAVRGTKENGIVAILHQLVYKCPPQCKRLGVIGVTTGPNMRIRVLNIFQKEGEV